MGNVNHLPEKIIDMIPAEPEMTEADLKVFPTLNFAQQVFVEHYAIYPNATQAYLKAYPACSVESAQPNSARLLSDKKIKDAVLEMQTLNKVRFSKIDKDFILSKILELLDSKSENIRVKALDLLSKIMGYNHQKITVDGVEPVNVVMSLPQLPSAIKADEDN